MKAIQCLRCKKAMNHIGTKKLQLGETGWILCDLPNLLAGAMEVDIYTCSQCGNIEFFQPDYEKNGIAMTQCPKCGCKHECDYPKCPCCNYDYYG